MSQEGCACSRRGFPDVRRQEIKITIAWSHRRPTRGNTNEKMWTLILRDSGQMRAGGGGKNRNVSISCCACLGGVAHPSPLAHRRAPRRLFPFFKLLTPGRTAPQLVAMPAAVCDILAAAPREWHAFSRIGGKQERRYVFGLGGDKKRPCKAAIVCQGAQPTSMGMRSSRVWDTAVGPRRPLVGTLSGAGEQGDSTSVDCSFARGLNWNISIHTHKPIWNRSEGNRSSESRWRVVWKSLASMSLFSCPSGSSLAQTTGFVASTPPNIPRPLDCPPSFRHSVPRPRFRSHSIQRMALK